MTNQSIRGENTADRESFMLNSNLWFCTWFLVVLLNVLSVVWCCDVSDCRIQCKKKGDEAKAE
jgi:hypothetical protein